MKRIFLSVLSVVGCLSAHAQVNDLPRTSPEAMGLKSAQVSAFFDSLLAYPKTEIHSAIVMRHGKVVGEMYPAPFRPEYKTPSSLVQRRSWLPPSALPSMRSCCDSTTGWFSSFRNICLQSSAGD